MLQCNNKDLLIELNRILGLKLIHRMFLGRISREGHCLRRWQKKIRIRLIVKMSSRG